MKSPLCMLLLIISLGAFSQKITGLVKDEQGRPVTSASVMLQLAKDSSISKITITNSAGMYEFLLAQPGRYFISLSHTGHSAKTSLPFEINGEDEIKIPTIVMEKAVIKIGRRRTNPD